MKIKENHLSQGLRGQWAVTTQDNTIFAWLRCFLLFTLESNFDEPETASAGQLVVEEALSLLLACVDLLVSLIISTLKKAPAEMQDGFYCCYDCKL